MLEELWSHLTRSLARTENLTLPIKLWVKKKNTNTCRLTISKWTMYFWKSDKSEVTCTALEKLHMKSRHLCIFQPNDQRKNNHGKKIKECTSDPQKNRSPFLRIIWTLIKAHETWTFKKCKQSHFVSQQCPHTVWCLQVLQICWNVSLQYMYVPWYQIKVENKDQFVNSLRFELTEIWENNFYFE